MSTATVIGISIIGGVGTFVVAMYYGAKACLNKSGPMIGEGRHMPNYSGHYEIDLLPVFVNLITCIQYFGEVLETYENRFGFFNQYRYGAYLITCPLMVYEIIHSIGAPYAVSMFSLTFVTIMIALFADVATTASSRWGWFTLGCTLNTLFFMMLLKIVRHAHILNKGLSSNSQIDAAIKRMGVDIGQLPKGLLNIQTPMNGHEDYINYAFGLMFCLWPVFPAMFCLEYSGIVSRNTTQIVFALTDLVIKTAHSYCLDKYKEALIKIVFAYGFLDTSVLYEINVNEDIYAQLKNLSRSMYGDLLVSDGGELNNHSNAGLNYQDLLLANKVNRKVDAFEEKKEVEQEKKQEEPKKEKEEETRKDYSMDESSMELRRVASRLLSSPNKNFASGRRLSKSAIAPVITPEMSEIVWH